MGKMRDWMKLSEVNSYDRELAEKKQAALDALDRVLGHQGFTKGPKIAAIREIEQAAKRMADQIERHLNDAESGSGIRR